MVTVGAGKKIISFPEGFANLEDCIAGAGSTEGVRLCHQQERWDTHSSRGLVASYGVLMFAATGRRRRHREGTRGGGQAGLEQ